MKDNARKDDAKRTTTTTLNQNKFRERERERERPRENFGFLLLSSYRLIVGSRAAARYYALKNEDYIYYYRSIIFLFHYDFVFGRGGGGRVFVSPSSSSSPSASFESCFTPSSPRRRRSSESARVIFSFNSIPFKLIIFATGVFNT